MDKKKGVRKILLTGIFWRILIIEAVLLLWSLAYRLLTEGTDAEDLFWYAVRILILIGIIILFMMVTFRGFLARKIILPLEAIVSANRRLREDEPDAREVDLPDDAPEEIKEIVSTRAELLKAILKVSEERLRLVTFVRDTFGRYLSKRVVDEILESPEGRQIGGRRERVTILMSDLRGFTSLSETEDPEKMVQILNRYLESMSRVILEFDGIIDEFIGDAILVVFGVPEKRKDDAARAVACGLTMQNVLLELNREITKEGYPSLEMGIGINTGTVIVGNIGSEVRLKYGIVGAAVNTASRIESITTGGQVLIGESTFQEIKELVIADPPQTAMMKGLKRPLVHYSVTGMAPPFDIQLNFREDRESGVEINLPFHCWGIEDKKIAVVSIPGETLMMNENIITVSVKSPLTPLTNIKLMFDFCIEAHCFDDIYAKVLSAGELRGQKIHHLRITSISQKDRDLLKTWTDAAH